MTKPELLAILEPQAKAIMAARPEIVIEFHPECYDNTIKAGRSFVMTMTNTEEPDPDKRLVRYGLTQQGVEAMTDATGIIEKRLNWYFPQDGAL